MLAKKLMSCLSVSECCSVPMRTKIPGRHCHIMEEERIKVSSKRGKVCRSVAERLSVKHCKGDDWEGRGIIAQKKRVGKGMEVKIAGGCGERLNVGQGRSMMARKTSGNKQEIRRGRESWQENGIHPNYKSIEKFHASVHLFNNGREKCGIVFNFQKGCIF